jgi:hypothetical protein
MAWRERDYPYSVVIVKAVCSSEVLIPVYQNTNPKDRNTNLHNREISKFKNVVSPLAHELCLYMYNCVFSADMRKTFTSKPSEHKCTLTWTEVVVHLFLCEIWLSVGVSIKMSSTFYPENGGTVSEMVVTIYQARRNHIREGSSLSSWMKYVFLNAVIQYPAF